MCLKMVAYPQKSRSFGCWEHDEPGPFEVLWLQSIQDIYLFWGFWGVGFRPQEFEIPNNPRKAKKIMSDRTKCPLFHLILSHRCSRGTGYRLSQNSARGRSSSNTFAVIRLRLPGELDQGVKLSSHKGCPSKSYGRS